jgi:hypothetical protein
MYRVRILNASMMRAFIFIHPWDSSTAVRVTDGRRILSDCFSFYFAFFYMAFATHKKPGLLIHRVKQATK